MVKNSCPSHLDRGDTLICNAMAHVGIKFTPTYYVYLKDMQLLDKSSQNLS
jgi:hypothetical protein